MFLSVFLGREQKQKLEVPFYNVGTGIFAFSESRRSLNMEHGNGNMDHVSVPCLLRSDYHLNLIFETYIIAKKRDLIRVNALYLLHLKRLIGPPLCETVNFIGEH